MPLFDVCCSKCKETIEIFSHTPEELPKSHSGCGGKLKRIFSFSYKIKTTCETVGSVADRNAGKMTDSEQQMAKEAQKTKKDSDLPGYNRNHPLWEKMKRYKP